MASPLLITHWDPDMYPAQPIPLLQELIVHILAHGEVWIKEVDLFLNPRIRSFLSHERNLAVFTSLVDTHRIKLLVPDIATILDLDRNDHPLLATAKWRDGRKPLKSKPWRLTSDVERYCARLDLVFGRAGRKSRGLPSRVSLCRPRRRASGQNQFAAKLHDVLTQPGKAWKRRDPFKGITEPMAEKFARYCEDYEIALDALHTANVRPNAQDGFYRSLAYQCADLFPNPGRQAMKNLVQSVYAYCELRREKASGTYCGQRLAEMPPDRETSEEIVRVEIVPVQGRDIRIPLIANVGEVISAVLEECADSMRVFWRVAGTDPAPQRHFEAAWGEVAESFARHARLLAQPSKGTVRRGAEVILQSAILALESIDPGGAMWKQVAGRPIDEGHVILSFGWALLDPVRSGRMRIRKKLRSEVNAAATLRCSQIV